MDVKYKVVKKKQQIQTEEEYIKDLKHSLDTALGEFRSYKNLSELTHGGAILSTVDFEYYNNMLAHLLEQEDYISNEEEAHSIIRLICADTLKEIMQPFLKKRLQENIDLINSLITDLQISKNDIAGQDEAQQYDESDYILHSLKYKTTPPLILFEQLISHYGIKFGIDNNNYLFKYYFTSDEFIDNFEDEITQWHYCDTLSEMLNHLSTELLGKIIATILRCMDDNCYSVKIPVSKYINQDILSKCNTPIDIYNYLDTLDIARLNLPLQHMYLLLNFEKFPIFKDTLTMSNLFNSLKSRKENSNNGYSNYILYEVLISIDKNK